MNATTYIVLAIFCSAAITFLLRLFPFVVFSKVTMGERMEKTVKLLPAAIIAVLVVYCLKDLPTSDAKTALVTLGSCLVVAVLHLWKKQTLLSIAGGTIVYMVAIRVFL